MVRRRMATAHAVQELNLVPYMDIMTNLVMFILVSMTSFVDMNVINVSAPTECRDCAGSARGRDLVVAVVEGRGFAVSLDGQFLEGSVDGLAVRGQVGDPYRYEALTARMAEVKRQVGAQTSVTLVADRGVDYATVVRTMDALRRDRGGAVLYPDVTLGVR
jgi:biopolymer transport protein TolR